MKTRPSRKVFDLMTAALALLATPPAFTLSSDFSGNPDTSLKLHAVSGYQAFLELGGSK